MLAVLDVEPTRLHLMIYKYIYIHISYVWCILHAGKWRFAHFFWCQKVNTRVVRSRQMPCESQRSLVHSISCPLVSTIHSGTNSFCNELEVSSKHLAKNCSHIKTRLIFDDFKIWCGPQMCATYCSFFPFPALATVESIDFIRHASPGGEIDLSFWR